MIFKLKILGFWTVRHNMLFGCLFGSINGAREPQIQLTLFQSVENQRKADMANDSASQDKAVTKSLTYFIAEDMIRIVERPGLKALMKTVGSKYKYNTIIFQFCIDIAINSSDNVQVSFGLDNYQIKYWFHDSPKIYGCFEQAGQF